MMNAKEKYRLRVQQETRKTASRNGEDWDSKSLRILETSLHLTDVALAHLLGRTQEAVSQQRYKTELRKKHAAVEKLPPTRFSYYYDSVITNVRFNHAGDLLAVFYPAGTEDVVLERAFESEGYDRALFIQWRQERQWNHG